MKKLLYALAGTALVAQNNVASAELKLFKWNEQTLGWSTQSVDLAIIEIIQTVSQFAMLLAVLYAVFGWFTILTAAGDEEKVKKWRTIIFHAILWLIVIYLAYSIIAWIINILFKTAG
jgi:hypothetical protein